MSKTDAPKMLCPKCNEEGPCKVIDYDEANQHLGGRYEPRSKMVNAAHLPTDWDLRQLLGFDLHWFRRVRKCKGCGHIWNTAEVSESDAEELLRLRVIVKSLRDDIERHKKAARKAVRAASRELKPIIAPD